MFTPTDNITQCLALPQEVLNLIPANITWKTKEGSFLGCNKPVADALKLNSADDMVGRTLEQVLAKKYAAPLLEHDQYVITNNCETIFEEVFFNNKGEQTVYLCRKAPLHNKDNEVIGVIAVGIDISDRLDLSKVVSVEKNLGAGELLLDKLANQLDIGRYYLPTPFVNCYLTRRELDCISHMLEGKSAKQIARQLNLSFRTIEFYVSKIKIKLKCRTTLELMSKINSIIMQKTVVNGDMRS